MKSRRNSSCCKGYVTTDMFSYSELVFVFAVTITKQEEDVRYMHVQSAFLHRN